RRTRMPAALRGAGRGSAKARSKSSASPARSRPGKGPAAQKTRAGFHLSPKLALACTGLAIGAALVVALTIDHRIQKTVAATGQAMIRQSAALGFKLDSVKLEGASAQSAPDILRAASLSTGAPLFAVD